MTPEEFDDYVLAGATREQFDASIREGLERLNVEGIDELLRECEAWPFDCTYLDAVIAHLTSVLNHRLRVVQAEAQFWAEVADEMNQQAAHFAAEFEKFRRLDVTSTIH